MAGKRCTCRASGRKATGIMCGSSLPGSGRDADVQGGGRTSLITGAACVSKGRVPAFLRIRLSEALAKAGRTFLFSESSRDPRHDPQAAAGGLPVPVIEIARKPETSGKTDRLRPDRQLFRAFGKAARAWRGVLPDRPENGGARGLSKYGFTNSARCGILELNDRLRHGAVSLPDERKGDAKCSRKFSPAFLR